MPRVCLFIASDNQRQRQIHGAVITEALPTDASIGQAAVLHREEIHQHPIDLHPCASGLNAASLGQSLPSFVAATCYSRGGI